MNLKKPQLLSLPNRPLQASSGQLETRSAFRRRGNLSRRPSAHALPPGRTPLLTKRGIPPLYPNTPFCIAHALARPLRHFVLRASALACLPPYPFRPFAEHPSTCERC